MTTTQTGAEAGTERTHDDPEPGMDMLKRDAEQEPVTVAADIDGGLKEALLTTLNSNRVPEYLVREDPESPDVREGHMAWVRKNQQASNGGEYSFGITLDSRSCPTEISSAVYQCRPPEEAFTDGTIASRESTNITVEFDEDGEAIDAEVRVVFTPYAIDGGTSGVLM